MKAVIWSPLAEERARAALEHVQRQGMGVAWGWQFRLLGFIRGLRRTAYDGYTVPELNRRFIGQVTLDNCRIIYRIDRRQVVVLTILLSRDQVDDHECNGEHHGE
ncbi:MAG TPA: type II toxin-antitoxin system RelE/ParE family toxin [Gemmatimonadaceae bacterium]|jgi:plasmid stabilization system protein ParE